MKRKIVYLATILLVVFSVFFTGCKDKEKDTNADKESVKSQETELLMSFDTYEEITGTSLRVGNQFGESAINKDTKYITEGDGSWMIKPQGNYGEEIAYPYFRMRCIDTEISQTTFKTGDYFNYDKVMLDVYNATDEVVKIQWNFTAADAFEEFSDTDSNVYELQPNAWTTCEYDLSTEDYGCFYDLTTVKFMKVTFLTKKENKDDSVATLYVDNLRAHIAEEERQTSAMEYDFSEGVDFEKITDKYLFRGNTGESYKMELSRVAYEDIDILPTTDEFGEYALMGNAGGRWPEVTVRFDKTYKKDMMLSFMMYVEVDESLIGDNKLRLESFNNNVDRIKNDVSYMTPAKFNQWVDVKIILGSDLDAIWFYANFDAGAGSSIFPSDASIKFYFDNFIITEKIEDVVKHADGSIDLLNPYNSTSVKYTFDKRVKENQSVIFSIDADPAREMSVWLLGDGMWEDEYYAKWYETWTGKQTIVVDIPADTENFTIHIKYRDLQAEAKGTDANFKDRVVTISNVRIVDDSEVDKINGITVKADGSVVITNPFNQDMVRYTFKKSVEKGEVIVFDIDVDPDREMAVWLYGDAKESAATEYYAKWYPKWTGKQTITVEAPADMKCFSIRVQHRDLKAEEAGTKADFSDRVVTVSNVRILTAEEYDKLDGIDVLQDGTVVISNPLNLDKVKYTFNKKVKAGEVVVFDIDVDPDREMAVWLYGNGVESTATEYYAKWYPKWTGKQTITVEAPKDMSSFMIKAQYRDLQAEEAGTDADFSNRVLTISNVRVLTAEEYDALDGITVLPDGTVQLSNPLNQDKLRYTFEKTVKEGDLIKFDIDVEPKREMAVWLYGDGVESTATEYYAKWYPTWTGKQTITVEAPKDMSSFMIRVQYRDLQAEATGTDPDFTDRVLTISNVKVEEQSQTPEIVAPDFYAGVTFEEAVHSEYITKQDEAKGHKIDFTRVQYAAEGIDTVDGLDAYGLKGTVGSSAKWPGFYVCYGESVPAGTGLSFMVYVKADSTNATYSIGGTDITKYVSKYPVNEWFEVRIIRNSASDSQLLWFNFDGTAWTNGLLDSGVTVYMDNFKLIESPKQTIDENTGDITVHTDWMNQGVNGSHYDVTYIWEQPLLTGQTLEFTFDEGDASSNGENGAVFFYVWDATSGKYIQNKASTWLQGKTFTYEATTDVTSMMLVVKYYDSDGSNVCDFTISYEITSESPFYSGVTFDEVNHTSYITKQDEAASHQIDFTQVQYSAEGITAVEGLGTNGLKGVVGSSAKWPGFHSNYGEEIPAGTGISFMMYVKVDDTNVTYSIGGKNVATNRDNVTKCNATLPINQWFEVRLIQNDAVSTELIYLDLSSAYDAGLLSSGVTVYMDNFKLIENPQQTIDETTGDITVHADWLKPTVTSSYAEVEYIWNVSLKTGDTIKFTMDENEATGTGAFWAYFPISGVYTEKAAGMWTQTANKTVTYTVTEDTETIKIKFRCISGGISAMQDFLIKDITITQAIQDITVTASELNGWVNGSHYRVEYIWNQTLSEGDTITFTFDEGDTTASNGAVFVYKGISGTYTQVTAKTWAQNRTQTYTATEDIDCIRLLIDYYDSDASAVSDFTIKDIVVKEAD